MPTIDPDQLTQRAAEMMNAAWREPGFCVPNQEVYPHQWLWDSCFHAIVWSALDLEDAPDRGAKEISRALAKQSPDGFVPHMNYWLTPELHAGFWGRSEASSITQPPMYGHAIATLISAGKDVPESLIHQAADGLANLARRTRTPSGLIPVFHPWETGCDDSARWDDWLDDPSQGDPAPGERRRLWRERKGQLVAALQLSPEGHAVGNAEFEVGSVGFNALVAFNAAELATVAPKRAVELIGLAAEIRSAVAGRWNGDGWPDDSQPDSRSGSGRIRTLDSLLALLIDPRPEGFAWLGSPQHFSAPFGPRGVDATEPSYDPGTYWRGPAWPQLSYLAMVAAERAGMAELAADIAAALVAGALESGLAEFWNPETGEGLGARPQTWAGLAVVAARRLE